jgi:hypothetical protein
MIVLLGNEPPLAEGDHPDGPAFTVAGFFYKNVTLPRERPEPGQSAEGVYPVLVAARLDSSAGTATPTTVPIHMILLALLLLALTTAYVLLKRNIRRGRPRRRYEPRRDKPIEPEDEDQSVDADLLRQLEQYKAEHGEQEKEDHG